MSMLEHYDAMRNFVVHNILSKCMKFNSPQKVVSIHCTVHNNASCHHKNYRKEYSSFQKQQAHTTLVLTSTMLAVVTGFVAIVLKKKTHTPVRGSVDPSVAITLIMRCLDAIAATPDCTNSAV